MGPRALHTLTPLLRHWLSLKESSSLTLRQATCLERSTVTRNVTPAAFRLRGLRSRAKTHIFSRIYYVAPVK